VLRELDRLVQQRLVRHHLAAARAGICADHHLRRGVLDARGERVRGEAAEHHGMDRADAGAGQHRERSFRDHGHVDQDAVALAHAEGLQHGGHALHFLLQLAEAVHMLLVRLAGDVDQGRLVAARGHVPIHRVVAQVGPAACEPAHERRLAHIADLLRLRLPVD